MRKKYSNVEEGFWEYAKLGEPDKCWEWQGKRDNHGYGVFYHNYKYHRVHCVAYELLRSPIPNGLKALHRCDNPSCYNPAHIFIGTQLENIQDMVEKGRNHRGERTGSAKLTEARVAQIKRELANSAEPYHLVAARYGVTTNAIFCIAKGKTWTHVVGPTPAEMTRLHPRTPWAKLGRDDIKEIHNLRNSGASMSAIARQYGIKPSNISHLFAGRIWRHVE